MMKKIAVFVSISLAILATAGSAVLAQAPAVSASKNPGYRIGPRDLLQVKVYEVPELNVERRVTETGMLSLPLIGDFKATGKTEEELAKSLKILLEERYVQRASVEIAVTEFRSRPITVIGAVKQPGNLAFSGEWTLVEALAAAGGLADNHGNVVHVLRRADNGLSDQVTIDLEELLVRAVPGVNIPILANDLINVPVMVERTIYCLGEVGRPGALEFKGSERPTLLAAIARAGGLTDRASRKIVVKRGQKETTVDYNRVVAGKETDPELGQGDIVVVKESFF